MCVHWEKHRENLSSKEISKLEALAARYGQTVPELIQWLAEH